MKPLGVTMPFTVADREYLAMAKFLNAVQDQCEVKMLSLQPLADKRSGLRSEIARKNCSYELRWENGMMMLGRIYRGKRERDLHQSKLIGQKC